MMLDAIIAIKIKTGAKKNDIILTTDDTIVISVTSRPIDGKANTHLIKILAKKLHIAKSLINIVKGKKNCNKTVAVSGMTMQEIIKKITI